MATIATILNEQRHWTSDAKPYHMKFPINSTTRCQVIRRWLTISKWRPEWYKYNRRLAENGHLASSSVIFGSKWRLISESIAAEHTFEADQRFERAGVGLLLIWAGVNGVNECLGLFSNSHSKHCPLHKVPALRSTYPILHTVRHFAHSARLSFIRKFPKMMQDIAKWRQSRSSRTQRRKVMKWTMRWGCQKMRESYGVPV